MPHVTYEVCVCDCVNLRNQLANPGAMSAQVSHASNGCESPFAPKNIRTQHTHSNAAARRTHNAKCVGDPGAANCAQRVVRARKPYGRPAIDAHTEICAHSHKWLSAAVRRDNRTDTDCERSHV